MRSDIERMQQEKTSYLERLVTEKEDLRTKQAKEAAATRSLDDEVKELGAEAVVDYRGARCLVRFGRR